MWDRATYAVQRTFLAPGEVLVVYSDGIVEAEDAGDRPFDECGLQTVLDSGTWSTVKELGWETFARVERHTREALRRANTLDPSVFYPSFF